MGGDKPLRLLRDEWRVSALHLAAELFVAVFLLQPVMARAEEARTSDTATVPSSVQTFTPADFVRFAPHNALDMLNQIPGFVLHISDNARGMGQASSNVLINGQRLSAKSDNEQVQLARIPAGNVVRIEIVDGANLGIPGLAGQVANVLVQSGGITGQFAWRGEARAHYSDPMFSRIDVSISGKAGGIGYSLGLSNPANHSAAGGPTRIEHTDGSLIEQRDDRFKGNTEQPKLTAAIGFGAVDAVQGNFNVAYRRVFYRLHQTGLRTGPGLIDRTRLYSVSDDTHDYELGGDLAFPLGPGRLKLIALDRYKLVPYAQQAIIIPADGSPRSGDRYAQTTGSGEIIARAEYGWKSGGADWQLSGEAAFNRLNNAASLFALDSAGQFTELPFPGGDGGVREARYESILGYSRALAKGLSLQLSAGGEYSRLSQSGTAAVQRAFWRPKGSLSLAYAPTRGMDLSLSLKRRVGQLDFGDFLARVYLESNFTNAGNTQLVPPQSWEIEFEARRNLGKWGSTTIKLYDYRISDLVDIVPVGNDGESPGNIDHARRLGITWTSTIELAPLGFKGAKLDAHIEFERARVRDPLTGAVRAISETQDRTIELDLRHDIPRTSLAWGAHFGTYHFAPYFRLRETGLEWEGPTWVGLFIEHKNMFGLTVNARAGNLLGARSLLDRTVWPGFRDRSAPAFTEHRNRLIGPIFSLSVKGNF